MCDHHRGCAGRVPTGRWEGAHVWVPTALLTWAGCPHSIRHRAGIPILTWHTLGCPATRSPPSPCLCMLTKAACPPTGADHRLCLPLPTPAEPAAPQLHPQGRDPAAHPAPRSPWPSAVLCCSHFLPLLLPHGECCWDSPRGGLSSSTEAQTCQWA